MTLLEDCKNCTRCSLRSGCNQVVPGYGPAGAKLFIVGEAPGFEEDLEGVGFVGRSGQLLRKLLLEAGINPEKSFITNSVKCRPSNNRTPTVEEITICKYWLWQELKNISPQVVLPLGKVAITLLLKLKPAFRVKDVVGHTYNMIYSPAKFMPWYHPSYLLRQGNALDKKTIDWFKQIKEQLRVE